MRKIKRKPGQSINLPLTDRERILMTIIDRLSTTFVLAPACRGSWERKNFLDGQGYEYVHFASYAEPKPGDLVLAKTGNVSEWKIGWYVEKRFGSLGGAVIREIGSDRLCNYDNESFVPIVGLDPIALLEGDKRQFYVRLMRAFAKGDEYMYRFGGLRFKGAEAVITIREVFGGLGAPSKPFDVRMVWNKRLSADKILASLRAGGYGTKSFMPAQTADSSHNGDAGSR